MQHQFKDCLVLTKIILVEEDDDVEIDVPIAMWVSLFKYFT